MEEINDDALSVQKVREQIVFHLALCEKHCVRYFDGDCSVFLYWVIIIYSIIDRLYFLN